MYPSTKYDLNGNLTTQDIRLGNGHMPNWQVGTKQVVFGSDYDIVEPISKIDGFPTQVEFELPTNKTILFGPMTKFSIEGCFQVKVDEATDWAAIPNATEAASVLLSPFWFEMLIKDISVFHNNYKVASSSETRFIAPFLHAYLHSYMEPTAKKILCPQEAHPAYCLPQKNEKWTIACEGYKSYANAVFKGAGGIKFEYTPLFLFPFYQGNNFMMEQEGVPRALHMPSLGRLQIRFNFHDNQDRIFQPVRNNTKKYRFIFTAFKMIVEQARLNPSMEKAIQGPKKALIYQGVTRLQLVETIPDQSTTYRTKFQDMIMPESLFIFCLDKKVASGTYSFATETSSNIFRDHNIQSVELMFNGQRYSIKEPHLGTFRNDEMDSKQLYDHIFNPPFGVRQDLALLTHAYTAEASLTTAFPHIYIPLTNGPNRQRIVPSHDNGSSIMKRADLEIDFKFTNTNSSSGCIYVIYACYTDVNMVFDYKNRVFYSPYLPYMN
jgi:hypothetical protein